MGRVAAVSFAFALLACGSEAPEHPSGALCSDHAQVSYEADIAPLMDKYCNHCHASELLPSERRGAPSDHNFDSEAGILAEAEHVDESAAAGPESVNTAMPPKGNRAPTVEERRLLGEWLACSAAPHDHDHDHTD